MKPRTKQERVAYFEYDEIDWDCGNKKYNSKQRDRKFWKKQMSKARRKEKYE